MPKPSDELLTIHVSIDLTPAAISAVVANLKAIPGKSKKIRYSFGTAYKTSEMISRFLPE